MDTDIYSANILSLGPLDNVFFEQIRGFVNTGHQVYKFAVEDWLRHEDIANLKLTAISFWHNNVTIKQFLAESMLDNDCNSLGQRLCIDLGRESSAPKACRGGSKQFH